MNLPPTVTEVEFLTAIDKVAVVLGPMFAFGYYEHDDIRQEIVLFALELLARGEYDPSRPLDGFLYVHAKRRLINLKRDKYIRHDPPCDRCHANDPCGGGVARCPEYERWLAIQVRKASLMGAKSAHAVGDAPPRFVGGPTAEEMAQANELLSLLDAELPIEVRADYLRLRDGAVIPSVNRQRVQRAVRRVLDRDGLTSGDVGFPLAA